MTAYLNLCNVLTEMYMVNYYTINHYVVNDENVGMFALHNDNVVPGLRDRFVDACKAIEKHVLSHCHTTKSYVYWDVYYFNHIKKAAWTVSHNKEFVQAVMNDVCSMWCD